MKLATKLVTKSVSRFLLFAEEELFAARTGLEHLARKRS